MKHKLFLITSLVLIFLFSCQSNKKERLVGNQKLTQTSNSNNTGQANSNDSITKKKVIIFIHGLSGGKESWKGDSKKYFELLSKEKMIANNYDLDTSFTYATKIIEISWWKKLKSLFKKSKNDKFNIPIRDLGLLLKNHIVTFYDKHESIVLITHSMGGLVAKQAMVEMNKGEKSKRILSQIDLYISLSVPHNGSLLANNNDVLDGLFGDNPQLKDLKVFSSFTSKLTRDYGSIKNHPKTIYQRGTYDIVVKEGSAIPAGEDEDNIIDSPDDHFSVRDIENPKTNLTYQKILKELKELLSNKTINGHKISLVPTIIFKPSRDNPKLKEKVRKYFQDYSKFISSSSIKLPDSLPEFHIGNDIHVCDGGYNFSEGRFEARNEIIASDKDLINRIHSHAILHNLVKSEQSDRFYRMRKSGHKAPLGGIAAAIESGICDYLVASYSNSSKIGETGYAECKDTTLLRDISVVKKLKEISLDTRYYEQGLAWSGIFWDLEKVIKDKDKVRNLAISFWVQLWVDKNEKFEDWSLPKVTSYFASIFEDKMGLERFKHLERIFEERGVKVNEMIKVKR